MSAISLSGCGLAPTAPAYQRPIIDLPASLPSPGGQAQVDWLQWWTGFGDPTLNALLQEAAAGAQDLALATARVAEARATLAQNQANFYPSVDLTGAATRRKGSENSASFNPASSSYSSDLQLGLTASYEIDFWGKFARADEAARARLLAQSANRGTVLTALYANVAQAYFALRALDAQTSLAEQTLATRTENLRLQNQRLQGGVIGQLDQRQAESEVAASDVVLRQTQQSRRNAESALALLVGRNPRDILNPRFAPGRDLSALYAAQVVPAELPSDVLARRPDIVSAEQALIAANADIGQARAAYFPRLSLTASAGLQSNDLNKLFDPGSLFWNLLGNLVQPIFRAGAIDAVVATANARQQQALATYTQSVQNAFRDVHDALNNVAAGNQVASASQTRLTALKDTLRLAELRYKSGYSNYLEVLNAQRDLAQAQIGLIEVQRGQLNAVVSLYKALGGGWDMSSVGSAEPDRAVVGKQ